jgi:DNA-binding NtrC family response regulator
LENVMERAFALSPGRAQIEVDDLPDELRTRAVATSADAVALGDDGIEFDRLVGDFERELIRRALEKSRGNKRMAADLLHIKRTTLIEKLKRLERS